MSRPDAYRLGRVPPLEQAKAQVAGKPARVPTWHRPTANSRWLASTARALWGQGAIEFTQAEGNAEALPELPAQQRLGEWMAEAPAVRLARLDIARRQAVARGERAKRVAGLDGDL